VKPVRVRKARTTSVCPVCRRLVLVGDLIASVRGGPWACLSHVTKAEHTGRQPWTTVTAPQARTATICHRVR
jgi:hypothetical protein